MSNPAIDKIKKMIAHEQSARSIGSLSEAEAFATKIQDMLITHKLSLSEIELDAEEHHEPIAEEAVTAKDTGLISRNRPQREMAALAEVVARAFFCRTVMYSYSNTVTFIGRESNRRVAVDLYKVLAVIAKRSFPDEVKRWKKTEDYKYATRFRSDRKAVMEFKYGYFLGFTRTIQFRFNQQQKVSLSSGEKGLVLVKRLDTDVDNHLAKMNLRVSKVRTVHFSSAGIDAGDRRAKDVSLTSKALLD